MADDRIKISIIATDGASKVFDAVGDSADELGDELTDVGKAAKQAGDSVEKSARSMEQYRDAMRQTGQGIALLTGAFVGYARQQQEHETNLRALDRLYGEAADSYVAFADSIQNTTIFSNDQALEAARIMGTLRENYDLTDQQIQQLIQTSADLAAMHGTTLTDAAQRISAAIRGEAESAEMLGLTLNQAAIDQGNLTLTMSNAEAAQFRYNALLEQSASSVGAAADAAETTAGKTKQLANEFQDAALSVVKFTGPVGEAAGAIGSFGLEAGLAVGGLAQLGRGLITAASAAGGLATMVGPAGLAIGLGVAAYAAWQLVDSMGESGLSASFVNAEATAEELTEQVAILTAGLSDAQLALDIFEGQAAFQPMIDDITRLNLLWKDFTSPTRGMPGGVEWTAEMEAEMDALIAAFGPSADAAMAEVEAAMADWSAIIGHHGAGAKAALEQAAEAWNIFEASAQTPEDVDALFATLDNIANILPELDKAALEAAAANEILTTSIKGQTVAQIAANAEFRQWLELHGLAAQYDQERGNPSKAQIEWLSKYAVGIDTATLALNAASPAVELVEKGTQTLTSTVDQATRSTLEWGQITGQVTGSIKPEIQEIADAYQELAASVAESFAGMNANTVLSSGFNAVIGGAQGFGSMAAQVADWSGSLAHASEGQAANQTELNNLYQNGKISLTTYNAALDANHRIQQANISVQEDSLRIQAKQLPVIADIAEAQADYVDTLADASVAEQTAALGYMDSTKSLQAMSLATLVAESSTASMQASTTEMIATIAAGDPVMRTMLEQMGLIEVGADGKITVNFGDAENATAAMTALNDTLLSVRDVIAEAFGITVNVNDNASGPLAAIQTALANLDGQTSTVYINTIGGGLTLGARNGGVLSYENGGLVMAELAEAGPELVRLANGGVAIAPTRGLYMVEPGSNVMPAQATQAEMKRRGSSSGPVQNFFGPSYHAITQDYSALAGRQAALAGRRR